MKYERVLVPLDGSKLAEQALKHASLLARSLRVPIHLLRVHDPAREELQASIAEQYLSAVAESLHQAGVPATSVLREGRPAWHIANEANKQPRTLVVMATHGQTGVGRFKLARVTEEALKDLTVPTLLVRSRPQRDFSPEVKLSDIVVPLVRDNLAEQVLPHVAQLATALDVTVILMTVEGPLYAISGGGLESPYDDATFLGEVAQQLTSLGCKVETEVISGSPADAILGFVQGAVGWMVAVATIDPLPPQTIVGRVTRELVSRSDVPVLVMRAR